MTSITASPRYRARRAGNYLRDLWNRREFAWFLAMGNLKARNASTALGLFWWVLNPFLLGMVYYLVFGIIFGGSRGPDFVGYLLSGMFVFHFTAQSLTGGANSILQNSKLLANIKFPRLILPLSAVIESSFGFLASLAVLQVILLFTSGVSLGVQSLVLLVIIPIHVLFNLGLSAGVARLAVPFRDINNIVPYVTRLWLYVSPIIWPLSFLDNAGPTLRSIVELNPMFHIIEVYRAAMLGADLIVGDLLASLAWAGLSIVIGVGSFVLFESRMVKYL